MKAGKCPLGEMALKVIIRKKKARCGYYVHMGRLCEACALNEQGAESSWVFPSWSVLGHSDREILKRLLPYLPTQILSPPF